LYSKYTYYHSYYSPKEEDEGDGASDEAPQELAAVGATEKPPKT
jgi:hypothetical protein